MYKVNITKLRKALMFWRNLPKEKFDFDSVVSNYDETSGCGTVCDLIGWLPEIFPEECFWTVQNVQNDMNCSVNDKYYPDVVFDLFGIDPKLAINMFMPSEQHQVHEYLEAVDAGATPATACDMIVNFIDLVESGEIHNHTALKAA